MCRLILVSLSLLVGCAGLGTARRLPPVAEGAVGGAVPTTSRAEAPEEPGPAEGTDESLPVVAQALEQALDSGRLAAGPVALRMSSTDALQALSQAAERVLSRAAQLVGVRNLRRVSRSVNDDCVGFVQLAYAVAGIDVVSDSFRDGENAVSAVFRNAQRRGALHRREPLPGDIVFFRETYDRNQDGQRNDGMTHVGVVEQVEPDGTITFIHRGRQGIKRARMNLRHPTARLHEGAVVNDILRPASRKERAYLTAELFAAFASARALQGG